MLYSNHLLFPKFKYIKKTSFSNWSSQKTIAVYELDWLERDKKLKERKDRKRKERRFGYAPYFPFFSTLPEPYESWMTGMQFAISSDYMDEIVRNAECVNYEWSKPRNFDTAIRDMCLGAGIAHSQVAFKLIADCAYDDEKVSFYRGDDKCILDNAMIYRFWMNQTGGGCVKYKAEIDVIEQRLKEPVRDKSYFSVCTGFVNSISEMEHARQEERDKIDVGEKVIKRVKLKKIPS